MTPEQLVNHQAERDAETAAHVAAAAHTQAALPLVYALDRAMEAVVEAAVRLVNEHDVRMTSSRGAIVPESALDRLRGAVAKMRDIPTGAPLGRRWKP